MDYTSVKILPGGGYWVSVPELGHHGTAIDFDQDKKPDAFVTGDAARYSELELNQIQQGSPAVSRKVQKAACDRSTEEVLVTDGKYLPAAKRFAKDAPKDHFYDRCPFKAVREIQENEFYTKQAGTAAFERGVAAATKVYDLVTEFVRTPENWHSSDGYGVKNDAGETLSITPEHIKGKVVSVNVRYGKLSSDGYPESGVMLKVEDPQVARELYKRWEAAVPKAEKVFE